MYDCSVVPQLLNIFLQTLFLLPLSKSKMVILICLYFSMFCHLPSLDFLYRIDNIFVVTITASFLQPFWWFFQVLKLEKKSQRQTFTPFFSRIRDFFVCLYYTIKAYLCHDLYHAGVDLKTAQHLLGHSDIKMTANIYTHVNKGAVKAASLKLNDFLSDSQNKKKPKIII